MRDVSVSPQVDVTRATYLSTVTVTVTVNAAELSRSLDRVAPAVSSDPKHPMLHCVLLERRDQTLRMVATDRSRLVVSDVTVLDSSDAKPLRALVAADALIGVHDSAGASDVTLDVKGDSLRLTMGDHTHTVELVRGEFPDYEGFLAATPAAGSLVVDRSALLSAIEQRADDEPLRFRFGPGGLEIGESSPICLAAEGGGGGSEVTFLLNPAFAHDAVQATAGDEVAIEASSPVSPVAVRSTSDESYTCVIMPIRVAEPRTRRARR